MDDRVRRQVERIHASTAMAVIVVTGGGAAALGWLLGVPGASRTVLELRVPYAPSALEEFLGYRPARVVTRETADAMAHQAYRHALVLASRKTDVVGIGCSAAIASDRPKRGEHRFFASSWSDHGRTTFNLTFVKGLRDRAGEDDVVSRVVLRALAQACHVAFDLPVPIDDRERIEIATSKHGDLLSRLIAGDVATVTVRSDGSMVADEPTVGGVLSGSFNPLHEGHLGLARAASAVLQSEVTFELSVTNVDKPPLERDEVLTRVGQFSGTASVVLTRAPTFVEKARLLPGCTFVVGWDTAWRLVDKRYYDGNRTGMLNALAQIRELGCSFLVAGRLEAGAFHTLEEVPVPSGFKGMLTPIPESAFRSDVSSTELRLAGRRA